MKVTTRNRIAGVKEQIHALSMELWNLSKEEDRPELSLTLHKSSLELALVKLELEGLVSD